MEESKTNLCVVCDAGPIIHLDELGCLKLLEDFKEILLPKTVLDEVKRYRPLALERSGLSVKLCSPEFPLHEPLKTMCRSFSLDAGEIEALAVMEQNPEAMFLTDDSSARLVADRMV